MSIEDDLFNALRYTGTGKGENINQLLNTLVRNAHINALKTMRQQIDQSIRRLQDITGTGGEYDPALDPYVILGVGQDATRIDIDKAFRRKAWAAHPDHGGSGEEMKKINIAYEAIKQFRGWK